MIALGDRTLHTALGQPAPEGCDGEHEHRTGAPGEPAPLVAAGDALTVRSQSMSDKRKLSQLAAKQKKKIDEPHPSATPHFSNTLPSRGLGGVRLQG